MDELLGQALPTYGAVEQETLRGLMEQIKGFTGSESATSRDVEALESEVEELERQRLDLEARLHPCHSPCNYAPLIYAERLLLDGYVAAFEDFEDYLKCLLARAESAHRDREAAKLRIDALQNSLDDIARTWEQVKAVSAELPKLNTDLRELDAQKFDLQQQLDAVNKECKSVEDNIARLLHPGVLLLHSLEANQCEEDVEIDCGRMCGMSAAAEAAAELREVTDACRRKRESIEKASADIVRLRSDVERRQLDLKALLAENIKVMLRQYDWSGEGTLSRMALVEVLDKLGIQEKGMTGSQVLDAFDAAQCDDIQYDTFVEWMWRQ